MLLPKGTGVRPLDYSGLVIVWVTFLAALFVSTLPLPEPIHLMRPQWVVMALIYWVIVLPYQVGVLSGWLLGLTLDVLYGAVLGQHALALAVVAYLSFSLHMRIRVFPAWQQCLAVFVLVGFYQLVVRIIQGAVGSVPHGAAYYLPSLASALLWPWTYLLLRFVQRHRAIA